MPIAEDILRHAARVLNEAGALFIGAGAGIGVDSGLPDFRGNEGFWKAYPPLRDLNISFAQMANPQWFTRDPTLAWGFYGHRLNLYRATTPHRGFEILREYSESKKGGALVFTSNVDGQFQKAGFEETQIVECHGSIHHLQCAVPCSDEIWPAGDLFIEVDAATFRAQNALPRCPRCGSLARPNILMFGDGRWNAARSDAQWNRALPWLNEYSGAMAVVEIGAGTAVPSVRIQCEELVQSRRAAAMLRINAREAEARPPIVSLPGGALEVLTQLREYSS